MSNSNANKLAELAEISRLSAKIMLDATPRLSIEQAEVVRGRLLECESIEEVKKIAKHLIPQT